MTDADAVGSALPLLSATPGDRREETRWVWRCGAKTGGQECGELRAERAPSQPPSAEWWWCQRDMLTEDSIQVAEEIGGRRYFRRRNKHPLRLFTSVVVSRARINAQTVRLPLRGDMSGRLNTHDRPHRHRPSARACKPHSQTLHIDHSVLRRVTFSPGGNPTTGARNSRSAL